MRSNPFVETRLDALRSFQRHANGVEPSAYKDLRVPLTAEMAGRRAISRFQVPLMYGEFRVAALNHKPVDGIRGHDPTNLALEFF
jgi:hypothetical protein